MSGDVWFVQFDPPANSEAATGAVIVANRMFWALGYWQVEQHLTRIHPEELKIGETATCARDDDTFWAARRVAAFTDGTIRAIVRTGGYSDVAAEAYLAEMLMKRRDKIARAYLPKINPIVEPALDEAGTLTFGNAAVSARVAADERVTTA